MRGHAYEIGGLVAVLEDTCTLATRNGVVGSLLHCTAVVMIYYRVNFSCGS
jgi:hypothetical protein